MQIDRIGFILHTERYDACVEFYRDILGFPVEFEKNEPDQVLSCLTIGQCYLMIERRGVAKGAPKTAEENPVTLRINVSDVAVAAAQLRERGVDVSVESFPWGVIGRFHDPDGNLCQLRSAGTFGA